MKDDAIKYEPQIIGNIGMFYAPFPSTLNVHQADPDHDVNAALVPFEMNRTVETGSPSG